MLTLMANTSKGGAVWCLIEMPILIGNFPTYIGHVPCVLPPNDGKTYPLDVYGPVGSQTDIGHLYGTHGNLDEPNPVEHSHVRGCLGSPGKAVGDNAALYGGSWTNLGRLAPSDLADPVYSYTGYLHPSGRYWTYDRNGVAIKRQNTTFVPQVSACPSPVQLLVTPIPSHGKILRPAMEYYTPISGHGWDYAYHIYTLSSGFVTPRKYVDHRRRRYWTKASVHGFPFFYQTNVYDTKITFTGIRGNSSGSWTLRGTYTRTSTTYMYEGTSSETKQIVNSSGAFDVDLRAVSPGKAKIVPMPDLTRLALHLAGTNEAMSRSYSTKGAAAARNAALSNVFGLSSNNLENASQITGSLSVLKDLIKGYNAVTSGDVVGALQAISGAYLWYSYAVAPGISDSKEIHDKTDSLVAHMGSESFLSQERQRGKFIPLNPDHGWLTFYYCTILSSLNNNCFAKLWTALSRLGFQPTLGQGWDFVPFSFVVDWFLKVGPALRQIEDYLNMRYIRDVACVIETFNVQRLVTPYELEPLTEWEVLGDYTEILYRRRISSQLGDFDPLAGQSESGLSLSQMAQGASLIVQQLD